MTTWTQLNPQLPLDTPYGPGFAIAIAQDSQDHETIYKIQLTVEERIGEIIDIRQSKIRAIGNSTFGRPWAARYSAPTSTESTNMDFRSPKNAAPFAASVPPPDVQPENDNSWDLVVEEDMPIAKKFAAEKRLEEILRKKEKVKGKGAGAKRPRR